MAWPKVKIGVDAASAISISIILFDLTLIPAAYNTPSRVTESVPTEKICSPANVKGRKSHRKISSILTGIRRLKTSLIGILAAITIKRLRIRADIRTKNLPDIATTTEKRKAVTILTRGSRC